MARCCRAGAGSSTPAPTAPSPKGRSLGGVRAPQAPTMVRPLLGSHTAPGPRRRIRTRRGHIGDHSVAMAARAVALNSPWDLALAGDRRTLYVAMAGGFGWRSASRRSAIRSPTPPPTLRRRTRRESRCSSRCRPWPRRCTQPTRGSTSLPRRGPRRGATRAPPVPPCPWSPPWSTPSARVGVDDVGLPPAPAIA